MLKSKTELRSWRFRPVFHDQLSVEPLKRTPSYYSEKISDCGRDQKAVFKVANHLLGRSNHLNYHLVNQIVTLLKSLTSFLTARLRKYTPALNMMLLQLQHRITFYLAVYIQATMCLEFSAYECQDISNLISSLPSKSCSLDPLPTYLVKPCSNELVSVICKILNCSLTQCHVPASLKVANITSTLKKLILIQGS